MRLDISWKLERNSTYYDIWRANADAMRTDQDINNSGKTIFVAWATIQRAIDNYRQYIVETSVSDPTQLISIYPDMDNLFVANPANVSGVTDAERTTIMSHWIGAAANFIVGSDLTNIDSHGMKLLTDPLVMEMADFAAMYPMQPRNPETGGTDSMQLAAWIGGPSRNGTALVILANYGPDEGQGGFNTSYVGVQNVSITLDDLGIGGSNWAVEHVWTKKMGKVESGGSLSAMLDAGESELLKLSKPS